jgi:murein DD-endopeptidase MepM/ murein hydrolase activator NlpD
LGLTNALTHGLGSVYCSKHSRLMRRLLAAALFLTLLLLPTHLPLWMDSFGARPVAAEPALRAFRGTVTPRATLAKALAGTLSPTAIHDLVEASRPVYNLARLTVGRPFAVLLDAEGLVQAFTYGIDELRTLRVTRRGDDLLAEVVSRRYETQVATVHATITSSLFTAVTAAGEDDQLALDLAEIFAWDVDFNTELQKGDSFRVAVEKLTLDGRFSRYGQILSAELVRGSRILRAVRFDSGSGTGYYAPDGTPLRKAFLRSPLKFTRITSRFTAARFHPILNVMRPHFGVDYAAAIGTPVMAAADGVVTLAGWQEGFGKTVKLRHANGYETLYGHLSRIAVGPGQRVHQGTPVGAVGMTGLATGPHLDYRMLRNGAFVDPLRIQSPPAEPIPDAERQEFNVVRAERIALLERPAAASIKTADSVIPHSASP